MINIHLPNGDGYLADLKIPLPKLISSPQITVSFQVTIFLCGEFLACDSTSLPKNMSKDTLILKMQCEPECNGSFLEVVDIENTSRNSQRRCVCILI